MMISVFIKKNEAGPEAGFAGDPAGGNKHPRDDYVNYMSFKSIGHRPLKERPQSCISDTALSVLCLNGKKMATQKHRRTQSRGVSASPKWSAERSYSVMENTTGSDSSSWHLQPLFPDLTTEQQREPHRLGKILKRDSLADSLIRKQSKIEEEYKGIRDFTRSSAKIPSNSRVTYKPPNGYTSFVSGKPLIYQDRPVSATEKAHQRFLEKLEAQNRMIQDLSDDDSDINGEIKKGKGILKIPSCSEMDVCLHSSCNGTSIRLAMDGLRIANDIERSLSTEPTPDVPAKDTDASLKASVENNREKKSDKNREIKGNIDQSRMNCRSNLITTGSNSIKRGELERMDKGHRPGTSNEQSEIAGFSIQEPNYNYQENSHKLYEWTSLTTT